MSGPEMPAEDGHLELADVAALLGKDDPPARLLEGTGDQSVDREVVGLLARVFGDKA